MTFMQPQYRQLTTRLEAMDWLLPTLARLVFGGVLLVYFLNSGLTKLGEGLWGVFNPSVGAYAQIFPRAIEAVGYDVDALSAFHRVVVVLGTISEFVLPLLIIFGFMTRLAALGMVGFVLVQSLTDLYGHNRQAEAGSWFDRFADSAIVDQRAFWLLLLAVLIIKGAGPVSLDWLVTRRSRSLR